MTPMKEWIETRWPLSSVMHLALDEEIPGGARFAYSLGVAVLVAFMLQTATGIMQLFFYVPSTDHAYDSIGYLRTRVPFGWLIHGLHYWGANAMIALVVFHMSRVFLWGAYKKPRELTWLAGVTLLLTTYVFSFTGTPLHWDQRGYWIGEVSTSIAGTAPVFGAFMKHCLRGGGDTMGQLALSRFFGLHTMLLPLALAGLFGIHFIAMRHFGSVGPWGVKNPPPGPLWPDQIFKDAVTGSAVVYILVALAVFFPPQYAGLVDPLDTSYIPMPEWNFLFFYEALKYFHGRFEAVGTVGVPTVLVLLLVLLPFVDRNPERNPLKRPIALAAALVLAAIVIGLSIEGCLSPFYGQTAAKRTARGESSTAAMIKAALAVKAGEAVETSPVTPSGEGAGKYSPPELEKKGPPGAASYSIGSAQRGADIFAKNCSPCHGPAGRSVLPNPGSREGRVPSLNPIDRELFNADAETFAQNIDRFIQHGSVPKGPKPVIRMPAFGETNNLTQQEIANVEAYVLSLNGVDRAQLINPGMMPKRFFALATVGYALVLLTLGGLRRRRYSE